MDKSRLQLMETAPVKVAIIKLAIPTMVAMVVQFVYNLTDTFFIGQTGDANMVAGISLAAPIFMLTQALGNVFAIGAASYISRKLGEKDYAEAKHTSAVAIYTAIALSLVAMTVFFIFMRPLLGIIGTSAATYAFTRDYLVIIAAFTPIPVLQVVLAGLVRSEGATRKAMNGMLIGIVTNIILDPIFILDWGLGLGTAGAAWATVIGNVFGVIFFIQHFLSKKTLLSIKPKDFKPSGTIYAQTFKIGIPSALSAMVMSVSFVLANVLASTYGDYVVAGNGVQMRVASLSFMMVMGLAQGYQPFAGYCYGARKYDRLNTGFKLTMLYSTLLSVTFMFIFLFFGKTLISLFIDDPLTVEAGARILRAFTVCIPFFGLQVTILVTFQATGKAVKAMVISLGRQCLVYLPLLFLLNALYGFEGYIYAQPIADIVTTVIAFLLSLSFLKEMHAMHKKEIEPAIADVPQGI